MSVAKLVATFVHHIQLVMEHIRMEIAYQPVVHCMWVKLQCELKSLGGTTSSHKGVEYAVLFYTPCFSDPNFIPRHGNETTGRYILTKIQTCLYTMYVCFAILL